MSLSPRIARPSVARMGSKREDSPPHLKAIRQLPCAVYGTLAPNDPHHLLRADNLPKGMGRTNFDRYAIPLGRKAHDELHADKVLGEENWLVSKGVLGRELATALWACRDGTLDDYLRIMDRHFQDQRMRLAAMREGK